MTKVIDETLDKELKDLIITKLVGEKRFKKGFVPDIIDFLLL